MSNRVYNIKDCIEFGVRGERVIAKYLLARPYVSGIVDARYLTQMQRKDVDFVLILNDFSKHPIEVKTDSYSSGNIFVEEKSSITANTQGCILKTQAVLLFYLFINEKVVYIINVSRFRSWYKANSERFRYIPAVRNKVNGREYASCGRLVPRKVLERECGDFIRKRYIAE